MELHSMRNRMVADRMRSLAIHGDRRRDPSPRRSLRRPLHTPGVER